MGPNPFYQEFTRGKKRGLFIRPKDFRIMWLYEFVFVSVISSISFFVKISSISVIWFLCSGYASSPFDILGLNLDVVNVTKCFG